MTSNLIKNISYFTIGRLSVTGLQTLFYFVIAFLVIPETFGEISYLISLAGTVSVISRFGFTNTIIVLHGKSNNKFVQEANLLSAILITIGSIILIPINEYAAIFCFGFSLYQMNQFNLIGLKHYKKFMYNGILKGILIVILPITLYFILDIGGVLLGMALGNLLASTNFIKSIMRKFEGFSEIRKNIHVIIHNFSVDISPSVTRYVDKLIIVPFFGFTFAGIYQFNIQILLLFEILPQGIHAFFLSEESSGKVPKKIYYYLIVGTTILVIIGITIIPILIEMFLPNYSIGTLGLQILMLSLFPLTFASILNAKLQASQSTKVGYTSPVRIGLLLILIPILGNSYGLEGLSIAIFVSSLAFAVILYLIYKMEKRIFQ